MYTCHHCKKKFNSLPYLSCTNDKKYCSLECFPDKGIDKPYSSTYFNLVERIRDIESRIKDIENLEQRIDLENEVKELSLSLQIEVYGDDEGLFYKRQIINLISDLDIVYEKVNNALIEIKPQLKPGIMIDQDELESTVGEELLASALDDLEENIAYCFFENLYMKTPDTTFTREVGRIKLAFRTLSEAKEISRQFVRSINQHKKRLNQEHIETLKENNYFVHITKFSQCPVCREWEEREDFMKDTNLNLYRCNIWSECSDFNDYYLNE